MSFDNSRYTFDPFKNYSGVIMEQGRVQLDSDWNEWVAELSRRIQAGTLDLMGHASYPPTTPSAFLINAASGSPNTVTIGCGRMYVDGLLAENHGDPTKAAWDPALAELSGVPQPIDPANPNPYPISFVNQPYLPGVITPADNGTYLAYLDVWTRAIDYLEDASLVDKAVGVDTTGRLQTIWQVKLMSTANIAGTLTCSTPDSEIPYPPHSAGQLTTDVAPNPSAGPCCLTDGSGYTGVENQFYRVEIHNAGQGSDAGAGATFKWSRDNASVETAVTAINSALNSVGATASQLMVQSLGRDQVLGFKNGDWIEVLDDWSELWGNPGVLCQIDSVSFPNKTITLTTTVNTTAATPGLGVAASFPTGTGNLTDPTRHTRIRRWDQSGKVYDIHGNQWCDLATTGGVIPVPASKTLVLENGITVTFGLNPAAGQFNIADFWTFAARTADGSVEKLNIAPPRGIHHHYTKLSIVTFTSPASYTDCRTPWTTGGNDDCGCCTVTVGDNITSFGKYSSIQQAINSLPTTGPNPGGEVCILPGRYFEYVTLNGLVDVVIHGCGAHTRLASPTFQQIQIEVAKRKTVNNAKATIKDTTKASFTANDTSDSGNTPESGLQAIITVIGCTDIEFRDFAIEAADTEVGILLDGTTVFNRYKYIDIDVLNKIPGKRPDYNLFVSEFPSNITITDLAITASTLPAIVAVDTNLLNVRNNRIAMKDVAGQWAGIYVSGSEIHIDGNWVGLQDSSSATTWMPNVVQTDVPDGFNSANAPASPIGNGGIHIAGPSQNVFVSDNQIEGGSRNGITLGSFALINANGADSGVLTGLLASPPDPASTTFTLQLPTSVVANDQDQKVVSGGLLQNIQISNNQIRSSGLCGIGPVGFFNLAESLEIITIQNLTITANTITGTLLDSLEGSAAGTTTLLGYGAICVPDVQNLIVRDNTITDFGILPGTYVCGIFIFNGEQVEISRNQVIETRDWSAIPNLANVPTGSARAGVSILFVTPPALDQLDTASAWAAATATSAAGVPLSNVPLYQPGLPALRMKENVVRVPLGLALEVLGVGPFALSNNHFSSGGTIPASTANLATGVSTTGFSSARSFTPFLTVLLVNLGKAIEIDTPGTSFASLFANGAQPTLNVSDNALSDSSSGQILFTNNQCALETRASGAQGTSSVAILTTDHLIFANNHLWIDGPPTAIMDALLVAGSMQVTSNRLQEGAGTVYVSGLTYGLSNITTMNTSTYCLFALGAPALSITTPNIVLNSTLCAELARKP